MESDAYRQRVLIARQHDGTFEPFPVWDDVRTFPSALFRDRVDVVSAGFPCQPFSPAGKKRGGDDGRNLWPETIGIIREVRPRFAFLENSAGLLAHPYFGTVLGDLAEAGFDAEWCVLGADDVGAPHIRKRVWILAYTMADSDRHGLEGILETGAAATSARGAREVADADEGRREGERQPEHGSEQGAFWDLVDGCSAGGPWHRPDWWDNDPAEARKPESYLGRVADGVANRRHRLSALGDGQVPAVAVCAWRILNGRFT